ncbi:putative transport protein [Buchnera aphidicola str. Bp (Baizongia pistaciae)]|uniref:Uncharacterized transporter bbp_411 n=1 Tax=Buchnera aphidicola subsp. Baizongia pistaciae (strain Bp) TaxID=224915 RepID=Y411_BUCBP|nr:MFS transporter [Buchnera aphidicola]Q89AA9.1 RecName: Full=Uncharacterized transporter bbp_411 [Buchnera aphidicola str. Bp (Baizongia pistaciae)]AAO27121.1 putative transport protein [Buchnera aphidicola str. Bp (Baizongia pistaciae)]
MSFDEIKTHNKKAIIGIFMIFSLRVFGMFMIVPVLSTYGMCLKNSNIFLVGVAIGIYGIFQIIFQIPYGWLSDKYGQKLIINIGLLCFLLGNIIAWSSNSIWGIILGRGLQGSGAISSVCMTLLSELVLPHNRIKIMGLLGVSFGISFFLAVILSPIIVNMFGFYCLFLINSLLSIFCLFFGMFYIPASLLNKNVVCNFRSEISNFFKILSNRVLCQINLSVFLIHFFLMCNFIIIPVELKKIFEFFEYVPEIIYIVILLVSFLIVLFCICFIQSKVLYSNITITTSAFLFVLCYGIFLLFGHNNISLILGLQIFFIAFIFLETILPALVNKFSSKNYKSTTMAIYSTSQFLGSSMGGIIGGILFSYLNYFEVLFFEFVVSILWFITSILYLIK